MSVARPARSLFGRCLVPTRSPTTAVPCRQLHSSAPRPKRRSRFRNVSAEELGLLDPSKRAEYRRETFPEYSDTDRAALSKKYTPEQLEAIEAGEKAVNPDDFIIQGRFRDDAHRPTYVEDFTVLNPKYDIKPEIEMTPTEPKWLSPSDWADAYGTKMMKLTEEKASNQATRAMIRAFKRVKESQGQDFLDLTPEELDDLENDPELLKKYLIEEGNEGAESGAEVPESATLTRAQIDQLDTAINEAWRKELNKLHKYDNDGELEPTNLELIEDGPAGANRIHTAEAPELGKVPGVEGLYKRAADADDEGRDDSGRYQELKRLTGMTLNEIQSLTCKTLVMRFVHNQTRLGKVRSTSILSIAGNGNGWLGIGMAKSTEPGIAGETAGILAIRNMKPIRRYENRTIYGDVKAKVSGTIVELFSRPPGFGLRCPHRIFEMCRAAGLHDISARIPRSKNPMNSVKATYQALMNQPNPESIAIGRGKKLVDVRKVYYGGAVH
ncbi:ribosomal protein [Hirsutella rhossiliensis]|uniref:Small ribosomal subunit protein uS5m n=1 Tax=Hirsutella rhossiliensis TaxID=111463 RepID=A0A9P8N6M5_9HYPO|nr:37S ribosomal protein S5 [Hirsutella rhossiliensis]KAH0966941.1 37S ribosomal protein S5 [Hirsutella rhossiliensis]